MTISNHDLVRSLKNGDNNAFNALYRKYSTRIFSFANSYVRDSFTAANLVQDAFLALWENRERLTSDTNVPSYLLTIVKNKALNHLNKIKTKIKVEENIQNHYSRELELRCETLNACNPEQLFQTDVEAIIQRTIASLPEQCRKTILLSRFEWLSNKEIAEKMNISLKGVEFHITRALKILRENLKDYLTCLIIFLINIFR